MAAILKLLAVSVVFTCVIYSGHAQCSMSKIIIDQKETGAQVGGKPEYETTINNDCACRQYNVMLDVSGFQTAETVDPSILKSDGLVNNGNPLPGAGEEGLKFKYAWDTMFLFKPVSSQVACS